MLYTNCHGTVELTTKVPCADTIEFTEAEFGTPLLFHWIAEVKLKRGELYKSTLLAFNNRVSYPFPHFGTTSVVV
jgi:hypothetical protein